MWDGRSLEKLVNRTTRRVHHRHIAGETCPWPLSSASTDNQPKLAPNAENCWPVIGQKMTDAPPVEEFRLLAEQEKRAALRLQEELLRRRFEEALQARERLEAEGRRALQAELQARFRARYEGLRAQMEVEKNQAVTETCRKLEDQLHAEEEESREKLVQALKDENQECLRRCVHEGERRVREKCNAKAEAERRLLLDRHDEEISDLKNRLQQLQAGLEKACRERLQYEAQFKKVQASYRSFVDLTDSSLHSDYVLKLRRLGQEPGLVDTGTQTDGI